MKRKILISLLIFQIIQISSHSFSQSNATITDLMSRSLTKTENGNLIIAGGSNNYPLILKLDASNNLIWSKKMTSTGEIYSVVAKNESVFLTNATQNYFRIMKLNTIGNIVWSQSNFQPTSSHLDSPLKIYSDTLICTFMSGNGLSIACLDTLGNILWNKSLPLTSEPYLLSDVWKFKDDIYVAFNDLGQHNMVKLSSNGNLIWHKSYFNNQLNVNYAANAIIHANGTFILTGTANNYGSYYLKVDTSGLFLGAKLFDYYSINLLNKSIFVNGKYYFAGFRDNSQSTMSTIRYYISEFDSNFNPLRQIHIDNITNAPMFHMDLIHDSVNFNMVQYHVPGSQLLQFNDIDQIVCDTLHFTIDTITIPGFTISNHTTLNSGSAFVPDNPIFQNGSVNVYSGCYTNGVNTKTPNDKIISIIPNPNLGRFTIEFPELNEPSKLGIYNSIGQKVLSEVINLKENYINLNLNLTKGIYFIRLESKNEIITSGKMIVE